MNVAWTRAAEGLPRRAFTVEHLRRMLEVGVISEDERVELVEGELVVIAAKGYAHELVKLALMEIFARAAGHDVRLGVEPDLVLLIRQKIGESTAGFIELEQGGCLLIVEGAQSSLGYDRGRKAALYARFGVQEFWVVDANARTAWVHTGPASDGWSSMVEHGPEDPIMTPALPGCSVKLGELE